MRLAVAPSLGIREMWGIVKDFQKVKKSKVLQKMKAQDMSSETISVPLDTPSDSTASLATGPPISEDTDLLKVALFICDQIADFHERAIK